MARFEREAQVLASLNHPQGATFPRATWYTRAAGPCSGSRSMPGAWW
jgi:hypothetical protein